MTSAASCPGTCTGTCSAEMAAAKCTGEIAPPNLSADCKAKCDTQISAGMVCSSSVIGVGIAGAADQKTADAFKLATEKNLPGITKLAVGMASRIPTMTAEVNDMVTGVQGAIKTAIPNPAAAAQANACFARSLSDVTASAAKLNASVNLSINIKAIVSGG
jgi:hypothetical protein